MSDWSLNHSISKRLHYFNRTTKIVLQLHHLHVTQLLQDWLHGFPRLLPIHTHPFNGPFSGTTQVSQYQKGKNWILLKQETVSGGGISWAICKSASRSRHITRPAPHHCFLQAGCPSCRPTNSFKALKVKALKAVTDTSEHLSIFTFQFFFFPPLVDDSMQ